MKDIVNSPLLVTLRRIVRTYLKLEKANAKLNQLVDKYVILPVLKLVEKIIPTDIDEIPLDLYEKVREYTLPLIQEKASALIDKYPSYEWDKGLLQVGADKAGIALKKLWNSYMRKRWSVDIITVGRNKKTGNPGERKVNIPEEAQKRNPRLQEEAANIIRKDMISDMVKSAFKQGMSVEARNKMEKYLSERFKDTDVPLTDDLSVGSEAIATQVFGSTSPNDYVRGQVLNDAQRQLKASKGGNEMPKTNHPQWYTKGIQTNLTTGLNFALKKMVTPLPSVTLASGANWSAIVNNSAPKMPTIAIHELILTIPSTNDTTWLDSMTILYKQIRAANSGARNYTSLILQKYLFNLRSMYAIYYTFKKMVALANNYDMLDATKPNLMIETAVGIYGSGTSDTITPTVLSELADLRTFGENLNSRLIHLFPCKCSLLERTEWLFSNVFADSNDKKADHHQFALCGGWVPYIDNANAIQNVNIDRHSICTNGALNTFRTAINTIIDAMQGIQDIEVLTGDLIKAFGTSLSFPKHDWSYRMPLPITYDEAALTQIQNENVVGPPVSAAELLKIYSWSAISGLSSNSEYQAGSITAPIGNTWSIFADTQYAWRNPVLNSNKDSLTLGEVLSLTRFITNYKVRMAITVVNTSTGVLFVTPESCGTEMVGVVTFTGIDNLITKDLASVSGSIGTFNSHKTGTGIQRDITGWSKIDYAPRLIGQVWNATQLIQHYDMFDTNNYALISTANLNDYHSKATYSMLQFPTIVDAFSLSALVGKQTASKDNKSYSKKSNKWEKSTK